VGGIRQQFSTPENILLSRFTAEFLASAPDLLAVEGEAPELGFVEGGYLFLATPAGMPALESNHAVQRSLGVEVAILEPPALAERFPWMDVSDLAAGSLGLKGEGWLDPYSLLQGFRRKAADQGVAFRRDRVAGIEVERGRVIGVGLSSGLELSPGILVNAAGPRAAEVASMAGIRDLPVRPRKRTVYRVHCRTSVEGAPLTIDPSGVYFRPEGPDFLCGVSPSPDRDPDTLDLDVDHGLFEAVVWPVLARRVPAFQALKLRSAWAGHYAVNTEDQNAILGPHPEVENLLFANGFSGHGLQHSPGIGRALSELILFGEYRTLELGRFGFGRFASGRLILERNVV
jgi:sarcosine oxidase